MAISALDLLELRFLASTTELTFPVGATSGEFDRLLHGGMAPIENIPLEIKRSPQGFMKNFSLVVLSHQ
jgi:hypothetical protein